MKLTENQLNKFVTKVMEVMYTRQEMQEGLVIEGPSTSKRNALDLDRFEILKSKI
jgi:hypothetical protein